MIYVIVSFKPGEELRGRVEALKSPVYAGESPSVYFVSYRGTTRELSDAIGYGDAQVGSGVVMPVSSYDGYASRDLWEWMEVYGKYD
ncbi:MAG: hypothetical protein OXU40_07310 [Nitrospira sp.]|nr:hypothetical protein [Nitrospira sp.]